MVNEALTYSDYSDDVQVFRNISHRLSRKVFNWRNLPGHKRSLGYEAGGHERGFSVARRPQLGSLKARIPAFALVALYTYLAFHAFSGSQGVIRWMDYAERKDRLQTKLTALETQRAALESQVKALKADGLDLDVLDIEARKNLYVSDPKELTIWLDPTP